MGQEYSDNVKGDNAKKNTQKDKSKSTNAVSSSKSKNIHTNLVKKNSSHVLKHPVLKNSKKTDA